MDEKQETEEQVVDLLPYMQDLVQKLNEIEVEKVKSPMHIRRTRIRVDEGLEPIRLYSDSE